MDAVTVAVRGGVTMEFGILLIMISLAALIGGAISERKLIIAVSALALGGALMRILCSLYPSVYLFK